MATKTKKSEAVTFSTAGLRHALAICGRVVPARSPKPACTHVLIGQGVVSATDTEVGVDVTIDSTADVRLLLPHARLSAIVASTASDTVALEPKGDAVVVTSGRGRWVLPTMDPAEFPTLEAEGLQPIARLPSDQFARGVASVAFATDTDSSRYALGAVMIAVVDGNPTLVATDGRRLAACECETDQAVDDSETMVPARVMQLLAAIAKGDDGSVQLERAGSHVVAEVANVTVTARLTEGRYPRWQEVFPEREVKPTLVPAASLLTAVRQASVCVSEQSLGVLFVFSADGIMLSAESAEAGKSLVECEVTMPGEACEIKLNPRFLEQWLKQVDPACEVEVEVADAQSAAVLRCDDARCVIMPLAAD